MQGDGEDKRKAMKVGSKCRTEKPAGKGQEAMGLFRSWPVPESAQAGSDGEQHVEEHAGAGEAEASRTFARWSPFEEGPSSISERLPSLKGRKLQDYIRQTYVLSTGSALSFYLSDGRSPCCFKFVCSMTQ